MNLMSNAFNQAANFKSGKAILFLLFFISMCVAVYAVHIYRLTIVNTFILFIASAMGSVITFLTVHVFIKSAYSRLWTLFISIAIGSGAFYFGFLFLNQRFLDKEIIRENFKIIKTGLLPSSRPTRCFEPYVVIDFHGTEKQLVFYCDSAEAIQNSSKVSLAYSKGLFGFAVIKSIQLVR